MKSTFTTLNAKFIFALIYLFSIGVIQAQNFTGTWGKTNGPCYAPSCVTPDVINFSVIANTSTTASATAACAPINNFTTIDYTFAAVQNFSGNNLLATFNANFAGKFLLIQLQDNLGTQTKYDFNYVLPIQQANTNYQYSIDFHPLAGTCNLNSISKIRLILYNAQTAGGNDATSNFTGNLTITYTLDNKKTGEVDLVPSSVSQVWLQEASNLIYNPSGAGVLFGAIPSQVDPSFLYPYYSATIKGRTNILGNDNAFEIWSNNLINGRRQYLGIGNYTFANNSEYSLINSGEFGAGGYYSKSLILQNNTGNLGIGTFTASPLAKFQVNGNALIGIHQPTNYTNYKLAVEGLFVSQQSVVTAVANWSDFVFKKEYKLPSLTEQEKFIQDNGHLNGIPSEQEVLTKGYDLAQMDAKFLQKMEELYLYTIELKKEIEKQKQEIEKLNNKIEQIENK